MSGVLLLWFELSWKNSEYLFTSHSNHQCVMKDEKKAKGNQANLWHACNTTFKPLRSFPWMNFPSIFRSVCCQLSRLSSITVAFLEPKLSWKTSRDLLVILGHRACRSSIYGKPDASIPVLLAWFVTVQKWHRDLYVGVMRERLIIPKGGWTWIKNMCSCNTSNLILSNSGCSSWWRYSQVYVICNLIGGKGIFLDSRMILD